MASEGGAPASQVPVPDNIPEEEFDLFGPGPVGAAENPFTQPAPTAAQTSPAKEVLLDRFSRQLVVLLLMEFLPLLLRAQEQTFRASC